MAKRRKKEDVLFIVSKSGDKKSRVDFYDKKGRAVPKDELIIRYKNSDTGRFITKRYSNDIVPNTPRGATRHPSRENSKTFPLGRDSRTGEFIPVREAERRPNTTTVERIPKDSPVYFERDNKRK